MEKGRKRKGEGRDMNKIEERTGKSIATNKL